MDKTQDRYMLTGKTFLSNAGDQRRSDTIASLQETERHLGSPSPDTGQFLSNEKL